MNKAFTFCILVLFGTQLLRAQSTSTSKGEEQIRLLIQQSVDDYNQGKYEDFIEYFSDHYARLKSGAPTIFKKGEAKIELLETIRANASSFELKLEIIPQAVKVSGNLAYDRGVFSLSFKSLSGGDWQSMKRRYLEVWEKETDGKWRIIETMDIDNFQ